METENVKKQQPNQSGENSPAFVLNQQVVSHFYTGSSCHLDNNVYKSIEKGSININSDI